MNIRGFSSFLIKADQICDFVPVLSTANNLIDLFIKTIVLPKLGPEETRPNHYYTHLDKKTFTRCTLLLIPILGQILVYLGDLLCDNKAFALELVKINGLHLRDVSKRLRNDKDVVLAAVTENKKAIKYAGDDACYDEEVMRLVAGPNYIPPVSDREKVLEDVKINPMAILDASEFWEDREIIMEAVKGDGNLYIYCSDELKDDDEVFLAAVVTNPKALKSASKRIQDSEHLVLEALRRAYEQGGAWVLQFASKRVLSNKPAMLEAIKIDPSAFSYLNKELQRDEEILQAQGSSLARSQLLTAIKKAPKAFLSIDKAFQKDPDILQVYNSSVARNRVKKQALAAIKKDPAAFFSLDRAFQEDFEVLRACHDSKVAKLLTQLGAANESIRDSEDIVLDALRKSHKEKGADILQFASERVLSNKPAMIEAIKIYPEAFFHIDVELQNNRDIRQAYNDSLA